MQAPPFPRHIVPPRSEYYSKPLRVTVLNVNTCTGKLNVPSILQHALLSEVLHNCITDGM